MTIDASASGPLTDGPGLITAADAAARLGVKRQTLYAYVSRGLLHRTVAIDGRSSLFDSSEIDSFRLGKVDKTEGEMRAVITTSITHVTDDALIIRGRDLVDLVAERHSFVEIVDFLWQSPDDESWPESDPDITTALEGIDGLRSLVAATSSADTLRHDLAPRSVRAAGRRMMTSMAHGLPARHKGSDATIPAAVWRRLASRKGRPAERAALDAALSLLVDHGLASSTFAARVAASVRADPYSVVSAGLGVVGGSLHGAASASVHELFDAAFRLDDAPRAVGDVLRSDGRVPGFGHTIYTRQDPRYGALMALVVEGWSNDPRLQAIYRVRDVVGERRSDVPNVDLALGALTWLARMDATAGETIFAIARTAGWLAHSMEEYDESPVRFRPRARYLAHRNP